MSKKNITLKDVAKVAGVSTATVARVIHSNGYIAEETRRQVEGALRKTGYRINVVAQGLRTQRTLSIGHILHSITPNPFYAGVALGAEQEAFKHGWSVLTINMQGSAERERRAVETLIQRRVDAILFTTAVDEANVRLALEADLLVVQIHRPTSITTHSVIVDNYFGSVAAMEHLIELGHRRIAFIGADPKCPLSDLAFRNHPGLVERERLAAYLDTLQKHHIPVEDDLIALGRYYSLHSENLTSDGYEAMKRFLQISPIPTAVFATCDILAAGVLQAVYEHSLRVPTDISVIGFDDTYAPYLTPPLTTVELPMTDIGKAAVRIVLEHSKHQEAASVHYQARLSTQLILRASTGPVPTA